jgi:hypothetical protein
MLNISGPEQPTAQTGESSRPHVKGEETANNDDVLPLFSTPEPTTFASVPVGQQQSNGNRSTDVTYGMGSDDERAFGELLHGESPSKYKQNDPYTTPVKRKHSTMISGGFPTPVTASRAADAPKNEMRSFLDLVSPDSTPTPLRFKDASAQGDSSDSLLTELLKVIHEEKISLTASSRARLKDICAQQARKISGLTQSYVKYCFLIQISVAKHLQW